MTPAKPAPKVKFEVAQEDLDILLDDLRALGCREARVVKVSDLAFLESISRKCEVPHCGSYGNTFSCPPHSADTAAMRTVIDEYEWALPPWGIPDPDCLTQPIILKKLSSP